MYQFSGIFFHVDLMDADTFLSACGLDLYASIPADRQIELGNLVVLWIVRIKIILSVKFAILGNRTIGCLKPVKIPAFRCRPGRYVYSVLLQTLWSRSRKFLSWSQVPHELPIRSRFHIVCSFSPPPILLTGFCDMLWSVQNYMLHE